MGKPILERLFEKKNRNKMTAAEKKAQERERKKAEKGPGEVEADSGRRAENDGHAQGNAEDSARGGEKHAAAGDPCGARHTAGNRAPGGDPGTGVAPHGGI